MCDGSSPNCIAGVHPISSAKAAILGKDSTVCGESSPPDSCLALDSERLTNNLELPSAVTSKDAFLPSACVIVKIDGGLD